MKDKINKVIGILHEEWRFQKSLENEQYPEVDITIDNLERAMEILKSIIE